MKNTYDLPAVIQHRNLLFDFYGSLLTERQADCFSMRYVDDLSLAEIGQELDISPQAVVDFLNRGIKSLERYEKHLELVAKFQQRQAIINKILSESKDMETIKKYANELLQI
ncbi:MAG: hypothetical protein FWE11_10125 [Defluviitaleaceae bacterium]|nr:hypothetical protein [Defluviitaleaceae bacterium]